MKLTIERDILAVALTRCGSVVKSDVILILGTVKLSASATGLIVTGANLKQEVIQTAICRTEIPGQICIEAEKLSALVNSLPKGSQLEIAVDGHRATVRYGTGRASFPTLPAEDFPAFDLSTEGEFSIDVADLAHLLKTPLPFIEAGNQARYYLDGIHLRCSGGGVRSAATDGKALASVALPLTAEFPKIIVPTAACNALLKILAGADSAAAVSINPNGMRVTIGSCTFSTRLVNGTFPDYSRAVPEKTEKPVVVSRDALGEIARRGQALIESARLLLLGLARPQVRLRCLVLSIPPKHCWVDS